jgi:hypothetical protein
MVPEFLKSRQALGVAALVVGVSALAFALFGWSAQTPHPLFGSYTWYMCLLGGVGALVSGTLMIHESLLGMKPTQRIKEPTIEFLVLADEEKQTVRT